jgi:nitroreductase
MLDSLTLLTERNSAARLTEPAPTGAARERLFAAALRAPDHAWLRPWRFITVEGPAREALGRTLERSLRRRDPGVDAAILEKTRAAPLRAPLVVIVLARIKDHPRVPPVEQRLSAGCAAHALLLAAEAQGFAGIWRTGGAAYDPATVRELGGDSTEEIVAFIYLGTRAGTAKTLPQLPITDFVSALPAADPEEKTP